MRVFYIALDTESFRIHQINSWLSQLGFPYQWISASKAADDRDHRYDDKRRLHSYGFPMAGAEIGCFLSHRTCWEGVAQTKEPTLILESDAVPDNLDVLIDLLDYLAKGDTMELYDVVRLSGVFPHNECLPRILGTFRQFKLTQCLGDPMGSAAYVVTPYAAQQLLRHSKRFFVPLDVFLGSTWKHRLRVRSLHPYPIKTLECESVIGDRRRPKQSKLQRLKIEYHRAYDDIKRVLYIPFHYWR